MLKADWGGTIGAEAKIILNMCAAFSDKIAKVKAVVDSALAERELFLAMTQKFKEYHIIDCDIVTNPPFGLATEFVDKCLHDMTPNHKLALFLKLQFLEGQDRFNKIYKLGHLKKIYIYSKRVACYKNDEMWQKNDDGSFKLDRNGNKIKTQSAVCYAWYIFDLSYNGKPEIDWITNFDNKTDQQFPSLFENNYVN